MRLRLEVLAEGMLLPGEAADGRVAVREQRPERVWSALPRREL